MLTNKGWAWLACLVASAVMWLGIIMVVKGCNQAVLDAEGRDFKCETEWGDVRCIAETP